MTKFKYIGTAITIIVSASFQHYIAPPDQCVLARICNHTWVAQCGQDFNNSNTRWFLDICDMYEFNCDQQRNFTNFENYKCPNTVTLQPSYNITYIPINKSSSNPTTIDGSNESLSNGIGEKRILKNSVLPVNIAVGTTLNVTSATVSSSVLDFNTTLVTSFSKSPESGTSRILPAKISKQQLLIGNITGNCTSITDTLPIASTSPLDTTTLLQIESISKLTLLSSIEPTTIIPEVSKSTTSSTVELVTANVSGSCTSVAETTQFDVQSITETKFKSTVEEVIKKTEPPYTMHVVNVTKIMNKSADENSSLQLCTRNLTSTSPSSTNKTLLITTRTTVMTTKNSTVSESLLSAVNNKNSTIFNKTFATKQANNISKEIKKTIEIGINNGYSTQTEMHVSNLVNLASNISNTSPIYSIQINATTDSGVKRKENKHSIVQCKAYPNNCNRPVTWETTETGETRDFYKILKSRFENRNIKRYNTLAKTFLRTSR